jgi:hypothetical protein
MHRGVGKQASLSLVFIKQKISSLSNEYGGYKGGHGLTVRVPHFRGKTASWRGLGVVGWKAKDRVEESPLAAWEKARASATGIMLYPLLWRV